MRDAISNLRKTPSHFGLAYDMWVPEGILGEAGDQVKIDERNRWLDGLQNICVDQDYEVAFERWRGGLLALAATQVEMESLSRLLIGHGNPSGSEVGLTVQHTWGAPMIPASSLKGLLLHHLVAKYGPVPDHWASHPLNSDHPESDRAAFQPAYWHKDNGSIIHSPGLAIRSIFGAPAALTDKQAEWANHTQVGMAKGSLQFLDAWWKPDTHRKPFALDILNVHQRKYYGQDGDHSWPNDYDSPNPVQFITVKPSQTFVLAICGEESLALWAMTELVDALSERGIGGKTTAGYGRLAVLRGKIDRKVEEESSVVLDDLKKCLDTETLPPDWTLVENQRQLLQFIKSDMLPRLMELNTSQRVKAGDAVKKKFGDHKKLKAAAFEIIGELVREN